MQCPILQFYGVPYYYYYWAGIAQSVLQLATVWTVRGSNPDGARFSAPVQTRPEIHPASYTVGTGSFPSVKRPGLGVDRSPPSSAEAFVAWYRVNFTFTLQLLLLLFDMDVSRHRPFLPRSSLEPAVMPTAQASSFTLQYFPYYV